MAKIHRLIEMHYLKVFIETLYKKSSDKKKKKININIKIKIKEKNHFYLSQQNIQLMS